MLYFSIYVKTIFFIINKKVLNTNYELELSNKADKVVG